MLTTSCRPSARRASWARRAVVTGLIALAGSAAAATSASATITCYYGVNPPGSNCGYKGLASGGVGTGQIDRETTTGEAMYNASTGTSKRIRIINGSGGHVAGWWSSSTQFFLIPWGAQAWVRGQCNNMEAYAVSVNCGFQW